MKKKFFSGIAMVAVVGMIGCLFGNTKVSNYTSMAAEAGVLVEETSVDESVIPDKYNTGASGLMAQVDLGDYVEGIQFKAGSNSTVNVMDFYYGNKGVSGTIEIKNKDFSAYPVAVYNGEKVERKIKIVFTNCKFSKVSWPKAAGPITCEFNQCTINYFAGGNATFHRCRLGQSCADGIVPFQNVEVNDCFFEDFASEISEEKILHSDGTQIYGSKGIDVENVTYRNCRFEVPSISSSVSKAYVNSCIMLQMEYSNADGVHFENCIVNGGGYSIYARSKSEEFYLKDIVFDGIRVGCADKYGVFYTRMNDTVTLENVRRTDSLYVGSVWKEAGETHVSVTNDTSVDRVLMVHTDKGTYQYAIAACPTGDQLSEQIVYDNLPFDMDIVIPADCEYVVCFDATTEGFGTQIRYENWGDKPVYLTQTMYSEVYYGQPKVVDYGSCGKNVDYTLTNDGVLTLRGKGATYAYHSAKLPPWWEYRKQIREVVVEEGVTQLGNQLFQGHSSIVKVTLPEGLKTIGGRTFANCQCLLEIVIPSTTESIGKAAFSGVMLQHVYYGGADWSDIEIAEGNDWLCMRAPTV